MNPKYPIYIPSKSRADTRLTIRTLSKMNVPFRVVVEPSEFDLYAQKINPHQILVLPEDNYKLFNARNWIKAHSISEGFEKHWQLDDNIRQFNRLNRNYQVRVSSGTIFRCAEDFCDRYENIAFAGFQYDFFARAKKKLPAFIFNTRIYSCTLIDNKFEYPWRSLYNDDTDVCLQALKDGKCTILFYAFLQEKMPTMTLSGGNTEELYLIEDGRLKMAQALCELHPDVCQIKWKFGRWQHSVNYHVFKRNRLETRGGLDLNNEINDYGMKLIEVKKNHARYSERGLEKKQKTKTSFENSYHGIHRDY